MSFCFRSTLSVDRMSTVVPTRRAGRPWSVVVSGRGTPNWVTAVNHWTDSAHCMDYTLYCSTFIQYM